MALLARCTEHCLEEPSDSDLRRVEYNGARHSIPIGHGAWATARVLGNVVAILLRERMHVNVTTSKIVTSSTKILRAVAGCSNDMACNDTEREAGRFLSPPEVWFAADVWITSLEERRLFRYVQSVGFVGYITNPGLNVYKHVNDTAFEDDGFYLGYYRFLETGASRYFSSLASLDLAIRSLGYTPGRSDNQEWPDLPLLGPEGIRLEDGWFISPHCNASARSGDRMCIPVVLGEPEWNFREWCVTTMNASMPFAVTFLGWQGEQAAVWGLNETESFLFYWWQPDPSFLSLSPQLVYFDELGVEISQFQQTQKIVWDGLYDVDSRVFEFLSRIQVPTAAMRAMIESWDSDPYDLACAWLTNNTNTWQAWLPQDFDCAPGFSFNNGTGRCVQCLPGTFKDFRGPAACTACGRGSFAGEPQASNCTRCTAGAYNNHTGATECTYCPVGTYQPGTGMVSCDGCPAPLTTEGVAARSDESCACPAGMYWTQDWCHPCKEGMACPFGSDMRYGEEGYPQVERGFMTLAHDPLEVYRCLHQDLCPGGRPASCAPNLDVTAVACGRCTRGWYKTPGACAECGRGSQSIPFVVGPVLALLCVAITFGMASDSSKLLINSSASVSVVIVISFLCTSIQALAVFREMPVSWPEALRFIQAATSFVSFNFEVLRAECLLGGSPVRHYIARQLVVPIGAVLIASGLFLKKHSPVRTFRKPQLRLFSEFVAIFGTVFNVFFISVLLSAITPFICYPHPGGSYSVFAYPSVLCWEQGRHPEMIAIACVSLLTMPVPFVALTILAVRIYPSAASSLTETSRFNTIRFLFFRFTPKRYYYLLILLARNTAICLVPVFLPGAGALQIFFASSILGFSTLLQQQLAPWRSKVCNLVEGGVSISLMLSLLCSALVTEAVASSRTETMVIGSFALGGLVISLAGPLLYFGSKRLQSRKPYQWFICHHKGHAAAQARYIKSLFQVRGLKVFIDSDDLVDLNQLFDIVKTQVQKLMVYLTSETLKRQWCAGEIVTATRHGIPITPVRTRSFRPPTLADLESLDTYMSPEDSSLQHYGVAQKDIQDAYAQFLAGHLGGVELNDKALGVRRFHELVSELAGQRPDAEEQAPTRIPRNEGMVTIVSGYHCDESIAASGILVDKIQEKLFRIVGESYCSLCNHEEHLDDVVDAVRVSGTIIFLLTPDSLTSLPELVAIVQAMAMHGDQGGDAGAHKAIVPVNTQNFIFPDENYYGTVLPQIWRAYSALGLPAGFAVPSGDLDTVRALIKSLFLLITVLFPTHASDTELEVQAERIFRRLKPGRDRGRLEASTRGGAMIGRATNATNATNAPSSWGGDRHGTWQTTSAESTMTGRTSDATSASAPWRGGDRHSTVQTNASIPEEAVRHSPGQAESTMTGRTSDVTSASAPWRGGDRHSTVQTNASIESAVHHSPGQVTGRSCS